MRKRIVTTLRGDSLPPVKREYVDDSRNPFEYDLSEHPEVGLVQVFVEVPAVAQQSDAKWVEVLFLMAPEVEG